MSGKQVILIGATGMVGGCALRICLEHPDIDMVTVVGRRSVGMDHSRLREILHDDFLDYTPIADTLRGHDVALYCLGVYTGAVPDDRFREITVDYTLSFAAALHEQSPQSAFCFLSGQGADQSVKSRIAFARYKGAAENGLLDIGFPRVHIFRPGYIYPVTSRKEPNISYRLFRVLYPLIRRIYPNIGISSEDLAHAMVYAGLHGIMRNADPVLENRDIKSLVT